MDEREPVIQEPDSNDATPKSMLSLLSGQLPLQSETTFFILANSLDIFLTYLLLRRGAMEANPIANFVFQKYDFVGMIAFKLGIVAVICVMAQVIALRKIQTARWLLWGGTAVVGGVVAYSMWLYYTNFA